MMRLKLDHLVKNNFFTAASQIVSKDNPSILTSADFFFEFLGLIVQSAHEKAKHEKACIYSIFPSLLSRKNALAEIVY